MSREAGSPSRDADHGCELESDSGPSRTRPSTRANSDYRPNRRGILATVGTLSLGLSAGCLSAIPGLEGTQHQELVEPEERGDDPDGTPGEFYHLIDEHGVVVDELYYNSDEERLDLFYDSNAETIEESNEDEIAVIYQAYQELIDHGSPVEALHTEIIEPFDGQAEGWHVQTTWVEQLLSEEATINELWAKVMESKVYSDGTEPDDGVPDESDPSTNDSGSTDSNESISDEEAEGNETDAE